MKHTMVITWESRWTSSDVLESDPGDNWVVIRSQAKDMVRDWVDEDAQGLQVSLDGVTLAEQGEAND